MCHRHLYYLCLIVALLFICAPTAFSQTAQVTGRVNDPNDAVVPGTRMIATNSGTGLKRETVTNDDGYYTLPLLPPGDYQMTVQKDGFKKAVRGRIIVQVQTGSRSTFHWNQATSRSRCRSRPKPGALSQPGRVPQPAG